MRNSHTGLILICGVAFGLCGCAPKTRSAYHLEPQRLVPPLIGSVIPVGKIRGSAACPSIASGSFRLEWKKDAGALHVSSTAEDGLSQKALDEWRFALVRAEADGCLRERGASIALQAMATSLALPSDVLYYIRYGTLYETGGIDLDPVFRLKVMSPLLLDKAKPLKVTATITSAGQPLEAKVENLAGYEDTYYRIEARADGGVRLVLGAVDQHLMPSGNAEAGMDAPRTVHPRKPEGAQPEFPSDARYYRMLFLRRLSKSDRDITLISARTLKQLNDASQRVDGAVDQAVACRNERTAHCSSIPEKSAINVELRVWVDRKEVYVSVRGTVGEALRASGFADPEALAKAGRVRVFRKWRGRDFPVVAATADDARLLSLVLLGDERISVQPTK